MKRWLIVFLMFSLLGCTPASPADEGPAEASNNVAPLPDLGAALELTNEVWLNTTEPLRLANLRGFVVLIEMWTFG